MSAETQIIFHICSRASWDAQSENDSYTHETLSSEGFIHCSTDYQVKGVLSRYFHGQNDLLLLTIDENLVKSDLKYEMATIGEYFPHIFAPIPKAAIVKVEDILVP